MECSKLLFIFFSSVNLCFAAIPNFKYQCVTNDNYTHGSAYEINLQRLSTQISSTKDFNYGFYNITVGKNPDRVNAIGLCRGDIKQDACKTCLNNSLLELEQSCPNNKEAVGWSDSRCMLHYSGRDIFGTKETTPDSFETTGRKSPNVDRFNLALTVDEIIELESLQYDFATIGAATNNFSDENKLGQGGFGAVYKGQLPNGQDVAVKRLSRGSGQGDLEFKNEVVLMANLQHRNLVKLLGFCLKGDERLLIYEFMPNSSLDHFIFDPINKAQLNWERRYKIIGGIARGLLYLHEDSQLRVIHRDLKPNNVLLDEEMNPKISDFGMARLFVVDDTQDSTSRVAGTYGYMAPEYVTHGHFSVKSDVFSFGVMLLEILSGQKNNSPCNGEDVANLISLAWRNWRDGTALNVVDPNLRAGSTAQMIRCIHVGLLCVQKNQLQRPTMGSIIVMLTDNSIALPTPSQPAYLLQSTTQSEMSSSNESQQPSNRLALASINCVSISELHPR
ncbi:hypothetical protein SLEP1_g29544 [Rubroshorea leprosula]|uniref:Uncharacterized protein n=1 Tax=Rubroshorea leprosula TaxID=152421 RepID=A0AAV5K677_9ROSI|nr:hypothetical protein SLEP1_g29544 [Rubroshorea leprosula]